MTINSFDGQYRFLSNFFTAPIIYEGLQYGSTEAAYQAAKCANLSDRNAFTSLTPGIAKKLGQTVAMRSDWDEIKGLVMYQLLRIKFDTYPSLKEMLLLTGNRILSEGNDWGDTFWGVCNGVGSNYLGKYLMHLRAEYRGEIYVKR